jgi:hypothetical protein
MPARVLMQDFTGVPAVVDLGAMRDAIRALGGDPERVNPLVPAELVIDHSVQVDEYGAGALDANTIAGVPTQPRAVCVFEVGADGVQELSARCRRGWGSATR